MSDQRHEDRFDEALAEAIRMEVEGDGGLGEHLAARRNLDARHRGQPKAQTMTDQVRGQTAASGTYDHPRWSDGTPILIDDEVEHVVEGWGGFVSGVPNSEEVDVCWYMGGGDISDAIGHAPEDLIRVSATTHQPLEARDG